MVLVGQRTQIQSYSYWIERKTSGKCVKMKKQKTIPHYIHSTKIIVQFFVNAIWLRCRIYVWSLFCDLVCRFCVCAFYLDRIDINSVLSTRKFLPDLRVFSIYSGCFISQKNFNKIHFSYRDTLKLFEILYAKQSKICINRSKTHTHTYIANEQKMVHLIKVLRKEFDEWEAWSVNTS